MCSSSIGARGASLSAGLGQAVLLKEASSKKLFQYRMKVENNKQNLQGKDKVFTSPSRITVLKKLELSP